MPGGRPKKIRRTILDPLVPVQEKQASIVKAFSSIIVPQETIDLDEWSDLFRVLPKETSSEDGRWRTSRFPFLRRIMKLLSPSSIAKEVVFMKGGQLGGTEVSICWILYSADRNPGPMAYVQRTGDAVKDFSKQKLRPSIKVCSAVDYSLGHKKPVGYSRALTNLGYPGGFLVLGAANSSDFLKSKSLSAAIMDEEDQYLLNLDNQGSPRKMLEKRMANFPESKLYRISTPVLKEMSTIEPGFQAGSEELFYVPCPNCNPTANHSKFMFAIEWECIKYSDELDPTTNEPVDVWCECPSCEHRIDEMKYKTWMLDNGEWYSTKNFDDPDEPLPRYKVGDVERPSFRLPSFYSPLGFYSWRDAVHDWFEYLRTKDPNLLQVFVNQCCAQTFSLVGGDIDYAGLFGRREHYSGSKNTFDVPKGGLCLTAGVDIQEDRIEVETVAWGLFDESWSIDYAVLVGDTALMGNKHGVLPNGQPSVWRLLNDYLGKKWRHETGVSMPVEATMIDTGYRPDEVHYFCKPREHMRIWPLKGAPGWGNGLWKRATRRHEKYKTIDYRGYTDEIKTKVYSLLAITEPGPGYCHFPVKPAYDQSHFKKLTAERRKTRMVRGQMQLYWENPSGARNEQLDCRNYAYVAFDSYNVDLDKRSAQGIRGIFGNEIARAPVRRRKRGSSGL